MAEPHQASRSRGPGRSRAWGLFLILVVWCVLWGGIQQARRVARQPDLEQRIAAKLVRWGVAPDGMRLPVRDEAVDRRIRMLQSPIGEERVQAARWLSARGVRRSEEAIAEAMNDPGTARPCQLAHELGGLGGDRWVGTLADAARNPSNTDLRVCATIALGKVASPKAVQALSEVYEQGTAATTAIEALGKIADPAALPLLRSVVESPRDEYEERTARKAIRRIQLMQRDDPVPALIQRLRRSVRQGRLDPWAVRKLVQQRDPRGLPVLRQALDDSELNVTADRVSIAAGLLAYGEDGAAALKTIVDAKVEKEGPGPRIARAALRLRHRQPGQRLASSPSSRSPQLAAPADPEAP